jgi:hypothetical protein
MSKPIDKVKINFLILKLIKFLGNDLLFLSLCDLNLIFLAVEPTVEPNKYLDFKANKIVNRTSKENTAKIKNQKAKLLI